MTPTPLPMPIEGADGWVKSVDPRTGRAFYANRITRVTQWEAPPGWIESDGTSASTASTIPTSNVNAKNNASVSDLPDGWEEMTDPTSGRKFYVDHASKVTTWERPRKKSSAAAASANNSSIHNVSGNDNLGISNAYENTYNSNMTQSEWLAAEEAAAIAAGFDFATTTTSNSNARNGGSATENEELALLGQNANVPDFKVRTIGDKERTNCPQCNQEFTYTTRRRHHCRLCGDVFCDSCSCNRCTLPLDGSEFDKPVRVCDWCHKDVDRGNYFSMRRYLPPLQLHEPGSPEPSNAEEVAGSATHVVAALGALSSDLDSILQDSSSFEEKITIPADILVHAICRHIDQSKTQEHAVRVLSTLLTIGSLVGADMYAQAVYKCELKELDTSSKSVIECLLRLLEKNSTSREVVAAQVHAARALFYVTDPKVISRMLSGESQSNGGVADFYAEIENSQEDEKKSEPEKFDAMTLESRLDVQRALRNMLDHSSSSGYPSLQRWATASIRHLVIEDRRRSIDEQSSYKSFIPKISSTGGVLILCSLMGASDSDTRAHATAALASIIVSARSIDSHLNSSSKKKLDKSLIASIVEADGCGSSLSELLRSTDDSVARMGCSFAASLVSPLLTEVIVRNHAVTKETKAYHDAAFSLCNDGPCLNALVEIFRTRSSKNRSTELIRLATETVAAICVACCATSEDVIHVSKASASISMLESVKVGEAALNILSSSQSISTRDSPSAQLREAAGILICAICYCSPSSAKALLSQRAISLMLSAASDDNMQVPSQIRGEKAIRCLPLLEAVSALVSQATSQQNQTGRPSDLDCLLEALESGVVPLVSRLMVAKIGFNTDKAVGDLSLKVVSCLIIDAMFSIAFYDSTQIGGSRLYEAILADAESGYRGRGNLISTTISLLQATTAHIQNEGGGTDWFGVSGNQDQAILLKLEEAALLAVASLCGAVSSTRAKTPSNFSDTSHQNVDDIIMAPKCFFENRYDACVATCGILFDGVETSIFSTMLVGGLGESCISPTLRLLAAVCVNGPDDLHPKLANSGILIPLSDILRNAMQLNCRFTTSACLAMFRYCGPRVSIDMNEGGGSIACVRDVIRTAASIIKGDEEVDEGNSKPMTSLKAEFLATLEALSGNASLWSAITSEALPALGIFLRLNLRYKNNILKCQSLLSVLRIVQGIIPLPSNAIAADRCGIPSAIAGLLGSESDDIDSKTVDEAYHVQLVALGVLRIFSGNADIRRGDKETTVGLVKAGVLAATFSSLCSIAVAPNTAFSAHIAQNGIHIIMDILSDLENKSNLDDIEKAAIAKSFVGVISNYPNFVCVLIATMLNDSKSTAVNYAPPSFESMTDLTSLSSMDSATRSIGAYGNSLVSLDEDCAGYPSTHDAAVGCLQKVSLLCSDTHGNKFWRAFFLENKDEEKENDEASSCADVAAACAYMLSYSTVAERDNTVFVFDESVQNKLLNGLRDNLESAKNNEQTRALLTAHNVPGVCVNFCRSTSESLRQSAASLICIIGENFPEMAKSFCSNKETLYVLLDLLKDSDSAGKISHILFSLTYNNELGRSIARHELRKHALECLIDGSVAEEDDEVHQLRTSTYNMGCIIAVIQKDLKGEGLATSSDELEVDKNEAVRMSSSLSSTISSLIRVRSEMSQDEFGGAKINDEYPEMILLCTLSSMKTAVPLLCEHGAIPALCAVASEGDLSSLNALHEAAKSNPELVVESGGHEAASKVLTEYEDTSNEVRAKCLFLLKEVCSGSRSRRRTVSESCNQCLYGCLMYLKDTSSADEESDEENLTSANTGSSDGINSKENEEEVQRGALAFLNELLKVENCRNSVLEDSEFFASIISLCNESRNDTIKYEAICLLVFMTPWILIENETLSVSVKNLYLDTLQADCQNQKIERSSVKARNASIVSKNTIIAKVLEGLEFFLDGMESYNDLSLDICSMCIKRVESLSSGLMKNSIIKDSGVFVSSSMSIFLILSGSSCGRDALLQEKVMNFLLTFPLLPVDELHTDANQPMWLAAKLQCIQCVAILTRFRLENKKHSWESVFMELDSADVPSWIVPKKKVNRKSKNKFVQKPFSQDKSSSTYIGMLRNNLEEVISNQSNAAFCNAAEKILGVIGF